ncbi:MAG: MFS transporter [Chloroflexota bacterium]|nr:MAG: MFS transporter [Chloroflexota bacterium]
MHMSVVVLPSKAAKLLRVRWPIWGILTIAMMLTMLQRVAPGAVADQIMADFGISGAVFGGLTSLFFYVYALMQMPSGILADRIGARKIVTVGSLGGAVGVLVFAFAPNLLIAYLGRFLVGLGLSVIYVNVVRVQTEWFRGREFASVSGALTFIVQCGALLGTAPLAMLATGIGWRSSFVLIGFLGAAIALLSWVLVRNRPADMGLPSIHEVETLERGEAIKRDHPAAPQPPILSALRMVLGHKHVWPPFLCGFGFYGSFVTFAGVWGVPYFMHTYGMQRTQAATYTLLITLGMMVGSFSVGLQSDRIFHRRKLPFILYGVLYGVMWLVLSLWNGGRPPITLLLPICLLLGFFCGGQVLMLPIVKETTPRQIVGTALGVANIGTIVGGALLQPLFGWALDLRWDGLVREGARIYPLAAYQLAFFIGAIFVAIGILGTLLVKETHCRDIVG